eukprot:2794440-Prymnesium_polylepis.1
MEAAYTSYQVGSLWRRRPTLRTPGSYPLRTPGSYPGRRADHPVDGARARGALWRRHHSTGLPAAGMRMRTRPPYKGRTRGREVPRDHVRTGRPC